MTRTPCRARGLDICYRIFHGAGNFSGLLKPKRRFASGLSWNSCPPPAGLALLGIGLLIGGQVEEARRRWLVFDFGPQFGDNFRGFLFLKALKAGHRDIELTCWITPELEKGLGGLKAKLDFIDRWLVARRTPRQTYDLNFGVMKKLAAKGLSFSLSSFTGGRGPDGVSYHKIIPNSEAWFSAKLLAGHELKAPDVMNQGEFLAGFFELAPEEVLAARPLFGKSGPVQSHVCTGLCRPTAQDPKQPARSLVDRAWRLLADSGREIYCLDYQDWRPPPKSQRIHDWRQKPWVEKIGILNLASMFVGLDGGLNHFAAACGCPTLSFYGRDLGPDAGLLVGPYPRDAVRGEHLFFGDFKEYLAAISSALA